MIFLQYLDESNLAYLIMIVCFLAMARLNNKTADENIRLRRILKNTVLGDDL